MYKKLKRTLKLKDAYLQLIQDISFDYDGYNTVDDLKSLIKELNEYAHLGLIEDDKTVFYKDKKGTYNILFEGVNDNE